MVSTDHQNDDDDDKCVLFLRACSSKWVVVLLDAEASMIGYVASLVFYQCAEERLEQV
jgi:hypothetical protein